VPADTSLGLSLMVSLSNHRLKLHKLILDIEGRNLVQLPGVSSGLPVAGSASLVFAAPFAASLLRPTPHGGHELAGRLYGLSLWDGGYRVY